MERKASLGLLAAVLTAACLHATGAEAAQSKCLVGKNKCMAKKAAALLKCHQKAETPGKPADPNAADCVTKAQNKFDGTPDPAKGCFEKLENKSTNDCLTFDDTASAETTVDNCVNAIVAGIDPGAIDQTKCGVGKKKCVAKKLAGILKCWQKAETPGKDPGPNAKGCIDKVVAKYDGGTDPSKGCFVKLESKPNNDCQPPTGNQGALETIVDGSTCVAGIIELIDNPTTTTTTLPSTPTILDFTNGAAGGTCGDTRNAGGTVIKTLTCGGLNIGGGGSTIAEGPTPAGSVSRFALSCTGSSCTVSPTTIVPAVNSATPDCTTTGCNFGTPLPIPNPGLPPLSTCVVNKLGTPASGTLDLASGVASLNIPLSSDVYLTGAALCPKCLVGGIAGPGTGVCGTGARSGQACTSTNPGGLTRDCLPLANTFIGAIPVNLSPATTGTRQSTAATGQFCTGQSTAGAGCFGSALCRTITENGVPAGALALGTPKSVTLASTFCIPATNNGAIDGSASLPGPGAVSLPGTFTIN